MAFIISWGRVKTKNKRNKNNKNPKTNYLMGRIEKAMTSIIII